MHSFSLVLALVLLSAGGLSAGGVLPVTPTYAVGAPAVVTAHSHQVFAQNHNRLYVPGYVPTALPLPVSAAAYPSYSYAATYPHTYRYGATYPYGYGYGYYPSYGYGYASPWWGVR